MWGGVPTAEQRRQKVEYACEADSMNSRDDEGTKGLEIGVIYDRTFTVEEKCLVMYRSSCGERCEERC